VVAALGFAAALVAFLGASTADFFAVGFLAGFFFNVTVFLLLAGAFFGAGFEAGLELLTGFLAAFLAGFRGTGLALVLLDLDRFAEVFLRDIKNE